METKHRTGCLIKRGKNFYVRWVIEGKLFSKALRDAYGNPVTTKRDAEEARQKFMAPFAVGDQVAALESIVGKLDGRKAELAKWEQEQNPPLPIDQAWTAFLASPNRPDSGPETLYQYKCQWSTFETWMKEKHPNNATLRDVTRDLAREYTATLTAQRLSPNTYNKHLNLLTLVFRVLKDKARLTANPWEDIQRKRFVSHSRRELTIDEMRDVCRSATGELRTLLALGIYSGLRLGDCATLRWAEVDLERGVIRRIPSKTARRNPKPVMVPIHSALSKMLSETPRRDRGDYVLPKTAALYNHRIDAVTDLVQNHFKACGITLHKPDTGQETTPDEEHQALTTTKNSEVRSRAVVEVGFHSLRHTFVSLCRESNAPLAVVESIVGHASPAMTRHYTHVGELAAAAAVAALPSVIGDATEAPNPTLQQLQTLVNKTQAILESMTEANWMAKRAACLSLLATAQPPKRQSRCPTAVRPEAP